MWKEVESEVGFVYTSAARVASRVWPGNGVCGVLVYSLTIILTEHFFFFDCTSRGTKVHSGI